MITELSAAQEARFGEFADRWTQIGLSTAPADRRRAENAIRLMYKCSGVNMYKCGGVKTPPAIVWCGSPLSQAVTRSVVMRIQSVGDSVVDSVRASVGASVVASVYDSVRASVGASVRDSVRDSVVASVRASVVASGGASIRDSVGASVGASVWDSVGASVWVSVWDSVGAYISSLFPNITKWKYIEHKEGINPFQAGIDLWKSGLVPSYDGKTWRLHSDRNAKIVYTLNQ